MRRYWKLKAEHEITLPVEHVLEEAVDPSQDSLCDGDISFILQLEVLSLPQRSPHLTSGLLPPLPIQGETNNIKNSISEGVSHIRPYIQHNN
jgi:hypothetical protein